MVSSLPINIEKLLNRSASPIGLNLIGSPTLNQRGPGSNDDDVMMMTQKYQCIIEIMSEIGI